jgi:hypothetical protein
LKPPGGLGCDAAIPTVIAACDRGPCSAQVVFTAVEAVSVEGVRFLRELEFIRALPSLAATGRLDVPTVDAPPVLSFTRGAVCWARGHPKKS